MRRTASEVINELESRVARLESDLRTARLGCIKLSQSILDDINEYIESVWGMDSEWCYNKVIDQKQEADKLYALIEVGCEGGGIDPEYMILSQKNNRQVLERMEILSLREAQKRFGLLR